MSRRVTIAPSHAVLAADLDSVDAVTIDETVRRLRALDAHIARLSASADDARPVVLPAYGASREVLNLTPLLALMLRHYDVPVLVHGSACAASAGVTTAAVLAELGIATAMDIREAQVRLARDGLACVALEVLAPPLAALLSSSTREGARTLARLIDPFGGDSYRVIGVPHADDLARMRELLAAIGARALLFVGSDGEPFADPRTPSRLEHFASGAASICAEADCEAPIDPLALPGAFDVQTTAEWTERALVGEVPIPVPLLTELACCLAGARRFGA